jgi:hypothetical protein
MERARYIEEEAKAEERYRKQVLELQQRNQPKNTVHYALY